MNLIEKAFSLSEEERQNITELLEEFENIIISLEEKETPDFELRIMDYLSKFEIDKETVMLICSSKVMKEIATRKTLLQTIDFVIFHINVYIPSILINPKSRTEPGTSLDFNAQENPNIFDENIRYKVMWSKFMTYPKETAAKLLNKIASGYVLDDLLTAYEEGNLNEIINITRDKENNCNLRPIESYYREQEIFNGFMCDLSKVFDEKDLNENNIPHTLYKLNSYKASRVPYVDEIAKLMIIFFEELHILNDEIDRLDKTIEDIPEFIDKYLQEYLSILKKWGPKLHEPEKEEYRAKINRFLSDKYAYTPEDMKALEDIFKTSRFISIYDEEVTKFKSKAERSEPTSVDHLLVKKSLSEDARKKLLKLIKTELEKGRERKSKRKAKQISTESQVIIVRAIIEAGVCNDSLRADKFDVRYLYRIITSFIMQTYCRNIWQDGIMKNISLTNDIWTDEIRNNKIWGTTIWKEDMLKENKYHVSEQIFVRSYGKSHTSEDLINVDKIEHKYSKEIKKLRDELKAKLKDEPKKMRNQTNIPNKDTPSQPNPLDKKNASSTASNKVSDEHKNEASGDNMNQLFDAYAEKFKPMTREEENQLWEEARKRFSKE